MANLLRKGDRTESAVPPTGTRSQTAVPSTRTTKKSDNAASKPWDVAQVWIESIMKQEATRKQWEQMYGWMADYDTKGNYKPRPRLSASSSRFSNKTPDTRGHDYGWHLQTELGQEIKTLQKRFDVQHKKRRATVVLGYD